MKSPRLKKMGNIVEENMIRLLDEGYFKSFPTSVVKRNIEKELQKAGYSSGDYTLQVDHDKENDIDLLVFATHYSFKDSDERWNIKALLNQCGWYFSDELPEEQADAYSAYIEPRYPIDSGNIEEFSKQVIGNYGTFYHVTFKKYEDKILKNGLVPSFSRRPEFEHPERIYLFARKKDAHQFAMLHKAVDSYAEYTKMVNKGVDSSNYEIVMLEVDLQKAWDDGKHVHLYHDNRYDESPVYFTSNTIHPKYIARSSTYEE